MEAKQITQEVFMTEKLYYEDSHMQEFTAVVISCEEDKKGYCTVLDRTAFFPEGGGQPGDTGWINDIRVMDTKEKRGIVYHMMEKPVEPGSMVNCRLDFEERFSRMQQHTGEHIVSGIVHSLFGYDNVGFHLGADVTTMDFNGELAPEQIQEAELWANRAVFANLPVEVLYPSREELETMEYRSKIEIEGQVRIVSISGVDLCACCAPHTSSTGEVGLIKLLSCEKHRGGCRVTMVSGLRALKDYQEKQNSVAVVSAALSAKPEKIGEAVLHLKAQSVKLREQMNRIQAVYFKEKLSGIRPEDSAVCIFEEEMDTVAVRNFVNDAMEICSGICGAFVGTDETGYRYILGSRTVDLREFVKELHRRFQGKGGGKPEMVQGSLVGKRDEIERMIRQQYT